MQPALRLEDLLRDADTYYANGSYSDATLRYRKAAESFSSAMGYNGWGLCLYDQGKYDEAIEKYKLAIPKSKVSDISTVYFNLGLAYYNQGNYDEAINSYTSAITYDEREVVFYFNLGLSLLKKQRCDEAMQIMLQGMDISKKESWQKTESIQRNENYIAVSKKLQAELEAQMRHLKAKETRLEHINKLMSANSHEALEKLVYPEDNKADKEEEGEKPKE